VKKLDKKIKKEGSVLKTCDKYFIKDYKTVFIEFANLKGSKTITKIEQQFLSFMLCIMLLNELDFLIYEKEVLEIIEKEGYIEVIKSLKIKGFLNNEIFIIYLNKFKINV
jgi:hypothetical protein